MVLCNSNSAEMNSSHCTSNFTNSRTSILLLANIFRFSQNLLFGFSRVSIPSFALRLVALQLASVIWLYVWLTNNAKQIKLSKGDKMNLLTFIHFWPDFIVCQSQSASAKDRWSGREGWGRKEGSKEGGCSAPPPPSVRPSDRPSTRSTFC